MSKILKLFAGLALLLGAIAFTPGNAQAQHWHHGWHRGPGWGWGPAFGFGLGFGYPYYYGGPYYAGPPACGWAPVYSRKTHRLVRQVWRCW